MRRTVITILLVFCLTCSIALGLDLKTAKQQGLVGETVSGYLAPVKTSPEVEKLVKEINAKRKHHYQAIANRNKTPLATVEKLAGKKAIEKTPPGQFINLGQGWIKKK